MSKEAYTEACVKLALKYVEDGTRFGVKDLEVVSSTPCMAELFLFGTFELKTRTYAHEAAGPASVLGDDEEAYTQKDFDERRAAIYREYLAGNSRFSKLDTELRKGYLTYLHGTNTCFETSAKEVHLEYGCSSCGGHGAVGCGSCGGSGEVSCSTCGGCGQCSCGFCGGSGQVMDTEWYTDHDGHSHSRTVWRSCSFCFGGRTTCSSCGGSGSYTCGSCGGSGQLTCGSCSGTGRRTLTGGAETRLEASFRYQLDGRLPEWVKDYLKARAGHADVAKLGRVKMTGLGIDKEKSLAKTEYVAMVPYMELVVKLRGVEYTLKLIGVEPRICDAGNIFQTMLQPDADALVAAGRGWQVLNPFYYRRVERAVSTFAESEVNQKLISQRAAGKRGEHLVKALDNMVSEEYVNTACAGLQTALYRAGAWSRVHRFAWTLLLLMPTIVGLLWVRELFNSHRIPSAQESVMLLQGDNLWDFVLLCLASWVLALGLNRFSGWNSRRWILRAGGPSLLSIARSTDVLPGKGTQRLNLATGVLAGFLAVSINPLWMDQQGRLQGVADIGLTAPEIIPEPVQKPAPKPAKAKKKTARKPKQAEPSTETTESSDRS